jgi:hypothetical protein
MLLNYLFVIVLLPFFKAKSLQKLWKPTPSLSPNKSIHRIRASQIILSLTDFVEKSNNIYDIKLAHYEYISYDI